FRGTRTSIPACDETLERLNHFLNWMRIVSKLHLVARALDSEFIMTEDMFLSHDDIEGINLAYALLRGEHLSVNIDDIVVNLAEALPNERRGAARLESTLPVTVQERPLGDIPISIDLAGYVWENLDEGRKV